MTSPATVQPEPRSAADDRSVAPPAIDLASVVRLAELADYVIPFCLRVVADLGVADALRAGPRPVTDLARESGAHPPTLLRVLRALAAKGIFTEVEPEVFGLTPLAQPLRTDHPLSLRDTYTLLESDVRSWAALAHTVRTGEPAFDAVHGQDYWTYLAGHPDESTRVDAWMASVNRLHVRTVLPAYPGWREVTTVVDLGGGTGGFLAGLLRRYPHLRGTLVDLPHVVAGAGEVLGAAGVADRCAVVPGSFFDPVPDGADAYLLKTVLPGFTDGEVLRILERVRDALRPESRLLLMEAVLPPGDAYDVAKLFDVHTMVLTGGRHRTVEHTEALLREVGLTLRLVRRTATLTILEATP